MENQTIREAVRRNRVRYWQLADFLKIHPSSLSIELRHEVPEARQTEILNAVETLGKAVTVT